MNIHTLMKKSTILFQVIDNGEIMKNKDREKLSAAFRIIALVVAIVMVIGIILQAFLY